MGNRMARKAVVVGEAEKMKKKNEAPGKSEQECRKSSTKEGTKQKKSVRFRVDDGEDEEERRKLGVVRIRLVVTREELRQILNGEESGGPYSSSSSEELLAAIKLGSRRRRRRRSSRIRMDDQRFSSSDGDMKSRKWRPELESIPEL